MKFSSYIDNILYCHFLNIRCGSTDNLELNGANFSNQVPGSRPYRIKSGNVGYGVGSLTFVHKPGARAVWRRADGVV